MCLFNPGQANSQCGHQECKNYYLFNKPICLKAAPPSEQRNSLQQISNDFNSNDAQTLLQPTSQNINSLLASKLIVPTTIKRSLPVKSEQNNEEEVEVAINKKKIKIDGGEISVEPNQMAQNPYFQMPANKDMISNPYMHNNMITQNKPILMNQQRENTSNSNQVLLSLLQNLQQSQANSNAQNQNMLKNMQYGIPNMGAGQGYVSAASPMQSQQDLFNQIQASAGGLDSKLPQELEEMINDFQTKTLGFLFNQNKMLVDLNEKNELVQETLACLIGEVTSLKNVVATKTQDKTETTNSNAKTTSSNTHQPIMTASESITSDDLLQYLHGDKLDFDYQLVLQSELGLPLYRERNFEFNINLIDNQGGIVENANKIPLTLSIYTCENPPKYIDSNTAGNKIFKGFTEKDLIRGNSGFEKIQIKEVTSHFRNGWIFLVVHPKVSNLPQSNIFLGKDGVLVDAAKIKPLILEKVIVKAKKTKEKDE